MPEKLVLVEICKVVRTGIRSEYFWRILSASALRFSKGCSSLNLERMFAVAWLLELVVVAFDE